MPIPRRPLLAALAAVPVAACTPIGKETPATSRPTSSAPWPSASPTPQLGKITTAVFDGAFGTAYIAKAGEVLAERDPSVRLSITPTSDIASLVEPQLRSETPPDLVDNSGPKAMALAAWTKELTDLTELVDSENLEGKKIRDSLYEGALSPGEQGERLLGINYALAVYGLWYSSSRLAAKGWKVPVAWDELHALGLELLAEGKFLFAFSPDAANYYQELAIASAIKEGGHIVRRGIDNLDLTCWSHPALEAVFSWLEQCVRSGLFVSYETYLDAQQAWVEGVSLLHPSGSWIAKEMTKAAGEDFAMEVATVPTVSAAPTLPVTAVHATAIEQFVIPAQASNPVGAKELLRAMLSAEACEWFTTENLMPTVVRGTMPKDLESSALASQTRLLADAGADVFTWRFDSYYGLAAAHNEIWTRVLSGEMTTPDLIGELQNVTNRAAEDPNLERYTVK